MCPGVAENLTLAVEAIAAVVPTHYAPEERIIGLLESSRQTGIRAVHNARYLLNSNDLCPRTSE
jgi:hypothetical protein